jgi:hypothetical protein
MGCASGVSHCGGRAGDGGKAGKSDDSGYVQLAPNTLLPSDLTATTPQAYPVDPASASVLAEATRNYSVAAQVRCLLP